MLKPCPARLIVKTQYVLRARAFRLDNSRGTGSGAFYVVFPGLLFYTIFARVSRIVIVVEGLKIEASFSMFLHKSC